MALKTAKRNVEETVEEENVEVTLDDVQLFKVTFRRKPPVVAAIARQRMYLTFGATEEDAIERVWNVFKGTSFHRDFEMGTATAELVVGRLYKIGG